MSLNFAETASALTDGVVGFITTRDLVSVRGADAHSFLQGQLSQDLSALSTGDCAESLLLSPQGKLEAYLRVRRQDDETFLLDCASGTGEIVKERLRRFKLRVKVELSLEQRAVVLVRGPNARDLIDGLDHLVPVFPYSWPGLNGFDVYVGYDELTSPPALGDPAALEVARIRAGEPVMGAELTEQTIAQETPLTARTVSFTKGCFTGQELVARLDARGSRVARHLRLLVVKPGERHRVPYVGEPIMVGDRQVGIVTSTAYSPLDGCSYALGYIHRSVEPPASAIVIAGDHEDNLVVEINSLEKIKP
ncbi:MAG TPA: glycine cleavage T C-terminal barrel domain-containing protein [Acidimicrobiales bacterium]|nr:glycine cleavage T C-terminal barrel domain-containing protein [Acidimicrobiales bacterium]